MTSYVDGGASDGSLFIGIVDACAVSAVDTAE